jgi:hypothetical protein
MRSPDAYERDGEQLRLYDPAAGRWLPTQDEQFALGRAQRDQIAAENQRLRREVEELRRRLSGSP